MLSSLARRPALLAASSTSSPLLLRARAAARVGSSSGLQQSSPLSSKSAAKAPPPPPPPSKKQAPPKPASPPPPAKAASPPPPPPKKASPPPPPPPPAHASPTLGHRLEALCGNLPHMDCVRYEHKNRTWSYQHVHYYSEALAIGLAELGFRKGDVVLSCLPSHFSEQMVLQFACSKAGFVLYSLDPALDSAAYKEALASALALSKANVLVSQEADADLNYVSLAHAVVPELRVYDAASGLPFVTPRFPSLRLCVHTGFDQDDGKYGWIPLRQMVVPSDNLSSYVSPGALSSSTPLAGTFELDARGVPAKVGPTLTNEQVDSAGSWPTVSSILRKDFRTVEGVGVVF